MNRILKNLVSSILNKAKNKDWISNHKYQPPVRLNLKTLEIEDLTTIDFFDVAVEQSDISEPGVLTRVSAQPVQNGSRIDYRYEYFFRCRTENKREEMLNALLNENWLLMYGEIITKISVHKKVIENKWITYTLRCEGMSFDSVYENAKTTQYVDFSVYENDIPIENIKISSKNREYITKLIERNTIKS